MRAKPILRFIKKKLPLFLKPHTKSNENSSRRIMTAPNPIRLRNLTSLYFGKVSSRGDFIRSTSGTRAIELIDHWVAQGMELLIDDPAWKNYYDSAGPIDFLLIGTRKKNAICGSLIASSDTSSRRFPFIAATLFEVSQSLVFLPLSPLMLERHVNHQRALTHHASRTHDASHTLATLNDVSLETEFDCGKFLQSYYDFLLNTTVADLTHVLSLQNMQSSVRQMALAIGYLLRPALTNYAVAPQKGICIPLPQNPLRVSLVKAFWLDLITTFLQRADFELSIFSCIYYGRPKLIITFNGTTPSVFHCLFNEHAGQSLLVDITDSEWVENYALQDIATRKLSSYLEHNELSLHQLLETFREGFSS